MGYLSNIDYGNSEFTSVTVGQTDIFYSKTGLIDDYLYFINKRLSLYLDCIFIPLNFENNTIISPELCLLFKIKQNGFQIDNETINDLYNEIKKGNSTIANCFIEQNLLNSKLELKDILQLNFSTFLRIINLFHKGITDLPFENDNYPIYFMKYSYPNYNVLKDFQSEYLIINIFQLKNDIIKYFKYSYQILKN